MCYACTVNFPHCDRQRQSDIKKTIADFVWHTRFNIETNKHKQQQKHLPTPILGAR